jgi:hypothetical protein
MCSIWEAAIMGRKSLIFALCCLAFLVLCGGAARAGQGPEACVTCHSSLGGALAQPVAEWKVSIHQQNGITCDLCHGGDASVPVGNVTRLSSSQFEAIRSRAMAVSHGFVGKPSGRAMFDLCGRCHGASVDRYAGSIMGRAYLGGKGGPSCVACHNAHNNIIPPVPKVCSGCHKDTVGFDQIDPMNVSDSTIAELSRIRIKLAGEKARGTGPAFLPEFPEDLGSFQIGFVAFGAIIALFLIGYVIYVILEKRR